MKYILLQLPGGVLAILTIMLVLVFLCAWKAPRWVRPIGSIALGLFALIYVFSLFGGFYDIQNYGDISTAVMVGGFKAWDWLIQYALFIYFISHVISFIQKPSH